MSWNHIITLTVLTHLMIACYTDAVTEGVQGVAPYDTCNCWLHGVDVKICVDMLFKINMDNEPMITFDHLMDMNASKLSGALQFLITNSRCESIDDETNTTIIESCPENMKKQDVKKLCEEENNNLPPVDYPGPIYLTFKNIYCALCHGLSEKIALSDLLPWSVNFNCENDQIYKWNVIKIMNGDGRCQRIYNPPLEKLNYWNIRKDIVYMTDEECASCLQLQQHNNRITRDNLHCGLCYFGNIYLKLQLNGFVASTKGLSVLFKLPKDIEYKIHINGGLFKASDVCNDNENFDILFQKCRFFKCGFGQYAKMGECHENKTVYVSPVSQPYPNGSSFLYINIEQTTNNATGPTLPEDLTKICNTLHLEWNFIKLPVSESQNIQTATIIVHINGVLISDILDVIGNSIFHTDETIYRFIITNFNEDENGDNLCSSSSFRCLNNTDVHFLKEMFFAKVDIGNRSLFYPIDNIRFDLIIISPLLQIFFNKICICDADFGQPDLNCSFPIYKYKHSEYNIQSDGMLQLNDKKIRFSASAFYLKDSEAFVCYNPDILRAFFHMDAVQNYIFFVCSGVSIICLLLSLVFYAIFDELCNIPAKLTIGLAFSLIIGQGSLLLPDLGVEVCPYIAAATHFAWLSAFMWMSAQALQMLITFHPKSFQTATAWHNKTLFRNYMLTCLAVPLVIVVICFVLDVISGDHLHVKYGVLSCSWMSDKFGYIFAFFVPVGMSLIFNAVCFCLTLYYIEQTMATSEIAVGRKRDKKRCLMYVKLSTVMGFTWIFGFIASSLDVVALWYVYIILNGLQGLFIFLSFCCNQRNRRLMITRMKQSKFLNPFHSEKSSESNKMFVSIVPSTNKT